MAVRTVNGVTILTPTAWKWWAIGATGLLVMPFGLLLLFFGGMMASGKGQSVMLTKDGVHVQNWWKTRKYRWDQIDDFRVKKIKSGLFTAATMISITDHGSANTAMGKFTKFVSGGTDSIPVIGASAQEMLALMYGYKAGRAPIDTMEGVPRVPPAPAPVPASASPTVARPEPVRGRRTQPSAPARSRPERQPVMTVKTQPQAKPKLGGRNAKQTPMVEDGFRLFGRRPKSPYG